MIISDTFLNANIKLIQKFKDSISIWLPQGKMKNIGSEYLVASLLNDFNNSFQMFYNIRYCN